MSIWVIFVLCFILILDLSHSQNINKRLSPIQIQNEDTLESKPNLQKALRNDLKSVTVQEGVVKPQAPEIKSLGHKNQLEYDSLDDIRYIDDEANDSPVIRGKKNIKQWDHWGKWTDCSVTCGVGKSVRWRHCVSNQCAAGEKEAQIKTCTRKPCP